MSYNRNGSVTIVIGESRGREGYDLTKYFSGGGSSRRNFPNERGLEVFLDEEAEKSGINIIPTKRISERTQRMVEKLQRKYA